MPDFYQGTEFWDLNLVDPDNRRPVDYDARRHALAAVQHADPSRLLAERADGRVKMFVAARALAARAALRDVYERGAYTPIAASGSRAGCVFAFARGRAVTCVPRLVATLTPDGSAPLGRAAWGDTRIVLSEAQPLHDVFTGAVLQPTATDGGFTLEAAAIFERFPVALLIPADGPALPAPPARPALPAPPA